MFCLFVSKWLEVFDARRTELSSQRTVLSRAGPVVGPGLIPVRSNTDHRFNGKAHARLRCSDGLILRVVGNVGSTVKELIDTVTAVGPNDTAVLTLGVFLDDIAILAEKCSWFDELDGLIQAFACCLSDANSIRVRQSFIANVVCLVQVSVESAVVKCNVDVQDITVLKDSLVGNAVANDFVDRCADRLGKVAVVEG